MEKGRDKKGLNPVVATVLLVVMVVIIGLIVFLWFRGITEETITKFGGENVKLVCDDVYFEADYSGTTLYVANSGNIPIFGMEVKAYTTGSHSTESLREFSSTWPDAGLNQGGTFSDDIVVNAEEIVLVPVLIGETDSGKKTYVCDEAQHGVSLIV
jgi:flagellin-like protein